MTTEEFLQDHLIAFLASTCVERGVYLMEKEERGEYDDELIEGERSLAKMLGDLERFCEVFELDYQEVIRIAQDSWFGYE